MIESVIRLFILRLYLLLSFFSYEIFLIYKPSLYSAHFLNTQTTYQISIGHQPPLCIQRFQYPYLITLSFSKNATGLSSQTTFPALSLVPN